MWASFFLNWELTHCSPLETWENEGFVLVCDSRSGQYVKAQKSWLESGLTRERCWENTARDSSQKLSSGLSAAWQMEKGYPVHDVFYAVLQWPLTSAYRPPLDLGCGAKYSKSIMKWEEILKGE